MTHLALLLALVQVPSWAFPMHRGESGPIDSATPLRVPGSQVTFTAAQLDNVFFVLDWYPNSHPTMPDVVARGRKPAVLACAYCHLPDGIGRPENAMLAGLPADYIVQQIADMKSGARRGASGGNDINVAPSARMANIAANATSDEIAQAAHYFASLPARQRAHVVESSEVPRTTVGVGLYFPSPAGGTEPLGTRLIEMPSDGARHERHDPYVDYAAYVPRGSLARGHALATTVCVSCHGPDLRGVGPAPPLAGRSPSYILRQLLAFKTGSRSTAAGAPMRAVATPLTIDDMIAAAAYAGSLTP
jgi:cytochrome c553